jgi:endonuclease/exonuclease/phosphatase family metal-dependent hydrolase
MSRPRLQILTYNIHKGFSLGNQRFVLHQIRDALEAANVDMILLQEIQGEHSGRRQRTPGWPDKSQFEFLADRLWPHYAYGKNAIYSSGHHGNAILSKYAFESWENIDLTLFKLASRSLLHGVVRIPHSRKPIHVICVHLALRASERSKHIVTLTDRINSHVPHDEPLIIAGDFNDWTGAAQRFFSKDLALSEVFQTLKGRYARTYPSWYPMLPVDRIYYRGVTPSLCARLDHGPWRSLSDHTPLYAAFDL